MNPTVFAVPAALACPAHATGCERTFPFDLRIEFLPSGGSSRIYVTPDADTAFLALTGHMIGVHGVELEQIGAYKIGAWAHEQVWAAAHAAAFDLGQGMREEGYQMNDAGQWSRPA